MTLTVLAAPPAAFVQDLGRPGHRALGIAPAGALDAASLRIANRLIGNDECAAGIEVALGGLRLRADDATTIAVTGAELALHVGGRPAALWCWHRVAAGEEISLGLATRGARAYVGIAGGVTDVMAADGSRATAALGSLSTDTLSGLGAPALAAGARVLTGNACPAPANDVAPWRAPGDFVTLRVRRGPRADWFSADAWERFTTSAWQVSMQADRVGIRLDGPALERTVTAELPSEGMVVGAVQVPPSGRPVILLADGPVTGGYPVIGVVAASDRDALGQLRPGAMVRWAL